MSLSVIFHYSALVLIGAGIVMLLPLAFSLYHRESDITAFPADEELVITAVEQCVKNSLYLLLRNLCAGS